MNKSCEIFEKIILTNNFFDTSDIYRIYVTSYSTFMNISFKLVYEYVQEMIYNESFYKTSSPPIDQVFIQFEILSRLRKNNSDLEDELIKKSYALKKCLAYTKHFYDSEKKPCYYCKILDDSYPKPFRFAHTWTLISLNETPLTCDTSVENDIRNVIDVTQCIYEDYPGKYTCIYHGTSGSDFTICCKCSDKYKFCSVGGYAESNGLQKKKLETYLMQLRNCSTNRSNIKNVQEYIFRYGDYNGTLCAPLEILNDLKEIIPKKQFYHLNGLKKSFAYK